MSWLARLAAARTKDFSINYLDEADDGFIPADAHTRRWGHRSGLRSNVVMAPVFWIMRNFTEAEFGVQRRRARGTWERVLDHELDLRLRRPNPFYGGDTLWKASLVSFELDGNAYWQKVRNAFGAVIGYWYIPHFLIDPVVRTPGGYIDYYTYRPTGPGGQPVTLLVRDVVHLRFGLDPLDIRRGLSPLKPLIREVMTDEEASMFSAAILHNMGVPGGVIAPKFADALPSDGDAAEMKEYMKGFTGNRRGDWLVLGTPTETSQFGFDPNSLMLGPLRDIAEERVCAVLGIPAAVVGFGAGLQQTKVGATMRELRQSAWHNCLIPQQTSIAEQLDIQTLPDFVAQVRRFRTFFDRNAVSAFQEEETERATRISTLVSRGVLRVDKGQEMLGLEVDETQRVYLRPSSWVAVPAETPIPSPPPPAQPPAASGGGGGGGGGRRQGSAEGTINRAAAALAAAASRNGR